MQRISLEYFAITKKTPTSIPRNPDSVLSLCSLRRVDNTVSKNVTLHVFVLTWILCFPYVGTKYKDAVKLG